MDGEPFVGTRISTTATTGWLDWFHGELWLFRDGILRVPIGWFKTLCFVGYLAERNNPIMKTFSAEEYSRLISNPRNLWIPRNAIKNANLHYSSLGAYDLRVQMLDGQSRQLLTLPKHSIYVQLQSALQEWLGEAFAS